jgi:hypothetical protein
LLVASTKRVILPLPQRMPDFHDGGFTFHVLDHIGRTVATVTTGKGGRFIVALKQGAYFLDVLAPGKARPGQNPVWRLVSAAVEPGRYTVLHLTIPAPGPGLYFLQ